MTRRKPLEADARAWLDLAKDYSWAANSLLDLQVSGKGTILMKGLYLTRSPSINFLYCHTVELCLKAAIKAMGGDVYISHDLVMLHAEANRLGLRIPEGETVRETECCLQALQQENVSQAFRYYDGYIGNSLDARLIRPFAQRLLIASEALVMQNAPGIVSRRRKWASVMPGRIVPFTIEEQRALGVGLPKKVSDIEP